MQEFDSAYGLFFPEVELDPVILALVPLFGHAFLSGYLPHSRTTRGNTAPVCLAWWGDQPSHVCGEETRRKGENMIVPSIRLLH